MVLIKFAILNVLKKFEFSPQKRSGQYFISNGQYFRSNRQYSSSNGQCIQITGNSTGSNSHISLSIMELCIKHRMIGWFPPGGDHPRNIRRGECFSDQHLRFSLPGTKRSNNILRFPGPYRFYNTSRNLMMCQPAGCAVFQVEPELDLMVTDMCRHRNSSFYFSKVGTAAVHME